MLHTLTQEEHRKETARRTHKDLTAMNGNSVVRVQRIMWKSKEICMCQLGGFPLIIPYKQAPCLKTASLSDREFLAEVSRSFLVRSGYMKYGQENSYRY